MTSGRLELLQGAPAHPGTITVLGTGALNGEGSAGSISVTWGMISPGATNSFNAARLQATNITLGGTSATYVVDLNGTGGAGIGHDQLDAGSIALGGASANLSIRVNYSPTPGTQYTIANNVTGTFAGLAEGAFVVGGRHPLPHHVSGWRRQRLRADRGRSALHFPDQSADDRREPRDGAHLLHGLRRFHRRRFARRHRRRPRTRRSSWTRTSRSTETPGRRTITATPTALENGQTTITVSVSDGSNTRRTHSSSP